jgi:hypothetical protein
MVGFLNMSTSLQNKFAAFMQLGKAQFLCLTENMESLNISWNMLSCIVHQAQTIF